MTLPCASAGARPCGSRKQRLRRGRPSPAPRAAVNRATQRWAITTALTLRPSAKPRFRGQFYYGFAEKDPNAIPPIRLAAFAGSQVDYCCEMHPGAEHGYALPDRDIHDKRAANRDWELIFAMFPPAALGLNCPSPQSQTPVQEGIKGYQLLPRSRLCNRPAQSSAYARRASSAIARARASPPVHPAAIGRDSSEGRRSSDIGMPRRHRYP